MNATGNGGRAAGENVTLTLEQGGVAVITMDYQARRNALSLPLRQGLYDRLAEAMDSPDCRVIVLTGAGGCFCSGGDISSMEGLDGFGGRARLQRVHRLMRLLLEGEKPVIAAVEGWAVGAGLTLAAACDMVVAARDARFACSFNKIGLAPDLGAAYVLPLRMGMGRARQVMMVGDTFDAERAAAWGLVEQVCDSGRALDEALGLAARLAEVAPLALGVTKALLARMPASLDAMLKAEADAQSLLFTTGDFAEGRAAFLAKRTPRFQGR